ncbi:MAG: SAM hydrolase/SAM-dependent halogenase family protein [Bryobacteraceae bacterium]
MMRGGRLIALLTDFGWQDPFVGVMKGVIAGIAPAARVVDLCHEVQPQEIDQARFLLRVSRPYFPKGTIFVCVVDPGVGSARRALCVEAGGQVFIGPDNGLFTEVLAEKSAKARAITSERHRLARVSQTFHGRDVFAPAAAHLAAGVPASKLGRLVRDPVRLPPLDPVRTGRRFWLGRVMHIDRFGNLITNLPSEEFLPPAVRGIQAAVGFERITRVCRFYEEAPEGEAFLIAGSSATVEVSVKRGSAAKKLGVGIGAPVDVEVW